MPNGNNSWKCSICGYVSDTERPPESCPVCGVPKEKFEPYSAPQSAGEKPAYWQCMVCGYRHKGAEPPETCPVCGVGREKFEGIRDTETGGSAETREKIVIAGAGIAGISAAEEIRRISKNTEIKLIHREEALPYYRLNLTRYIAGEIGKEVLPVHPAGWYEENNIDLLTEAEVVGIDPEKGSVTLKDGSTESFDKLILAAGSHPFMPPVPGSDLDGVTTLRTIEDAEDIIKRAGSVRSAVIIGGGVLGLEAAGALATRNGQMKITVVEGFEYLMPRQLNKKAASFLEKHMNSLGVDVVTGTSVKEITGKSGAESALLGNGSTIEAGLVIFSVGVRPATYLARGCGLSVSNGVIVDDNMETSAPGIYAAGDIAEHRGVLYGLWMASAFQGKIAGMNAAGKRAEFGGIPRSNTLKVLDVNLFSIGSFNPCDGSCTMVEEEDNGNYTCILFKDSKIEGAVLYGETDRSADLKTAIEEKISFPVSITGKGRPEDIYSFLNERI